MKEFLNSLDSLQERIKGAVEREVAKKQNKRRTATLSSEISRLITEEDNCLINIVKEIKLKEKNSNEKTIKKIKESHNKHMNSFLSDGEVDEIMKKKESVAEKYRNTTEIKKSI